MRAPACATGRIAAGRIGMSGKALHFRCHDLSVNAHAHAQAHARAHTHSAVARAGFRSYGWHKPLPVWEVTYKLPTCHEPCDAAAAGRLAPDVFMQTCPLAMPVWAGMLGCLLGVVNVYFLPLTQCRRRVPGN